MSLTGKEFHIKLQRKKNKLSDGYHYTPSLIRTDASAFKQKGILHKIDNLGRNIEGDKPNVSIEKHLKSLHPSTVQGKSVKYTLLTMDKGRKAGAKAVWKTALSAETVALNAKNIGKQKLITNLRYKADTSDSGKAVLSGVTVLRSANNARKVILQHKMQKKQYKNYVNDIKSKKAKLQNAKKKFKATPKNKERKFDKKDIKVQKKQLKNTKKLKRLSKPNSLVKTAGVSITTGGITRGMNQISKNAQDNDFAQATSKAVNLAQQTKSVKTTVKNHKFAKTQKKTQKLNKKSNKLANRRSKLTAKKKKPKVKRKKKFKPPAPKKIAQKFYKFILKFVGAIAFPLIIIIIFFTIVLSLFGGGAANNNAIMGTYYCSDYDMAQAIETYTDIAYAFNSKILKIQNKNNWKSTLRTMGINTSDMDDTPTSVIFGRSNKLNYNPVFDYDANKLIAFLCAYTYDFNDTEDKQQTWQYKDEYDDVLEDLFYEEYEYQAKYINESYWQQCNTYEVYPDRDTYYLCDATGTDYINGTKFGYVRYGSRGVPSEISRFARNKTVYFDYSTGEIKDCNKNYKRTGYYMQNMNYRYTDPSGNVIPSFYSTIVNPNNNTSFLGWIEDNQSFRKTQLVADGENFDWAVSASDMDMRYDDNYQGVRFFKQNEYITECKLYHNVKQLKTFDNAVKAILSDKSESTDDFNQRWQYYQILANLTTDENGKKMDTYGLHQIFKISPIPGNFKDATIYNQYGYDIKNWCEKHCDNTTHYGIDFVTNSGTNVYSVIKGEIESIDTSAHSITIKLSNDQEFWYEDNNKHSLKITYGNITAKSGLSVGATVDVGDYIGKVDNYRHCGGTNTNSGVDYLHFRVQVKYGILGIDWHDVDPQFLFYRENSN